MPRVLVIYDPEVPTLSMTVYRLPDDPEEAERIKAEIDAAPGEEFVMIDTPLCEFGS